MEKPSNPNAACVRIDWTFEAIMEIFVQVAGGRPIKRYQDDIKALLEIDRALHLESGGGQDDDGKVNP